MAEFPKNVLKEMRDTIKNYKPEIIGHIGNLGYGAKSEGRDMSIYVFSGKDAYNAIWGKIFLDNDKTAISVHFINKIGKNGDESIFHISDCTMQLNYEQAATVLKVFNKDSEKRKQAIQKLEEVLA